MPETHGTPCPELKKLMEIVEKHEQRLGRGNIEFPPSSTLSWRFLPPSVSLSAVRSYL